MDYVWATLLMLILAVAWALNLFVLPGNWVMVAAAAVYAWLGAFSWWGTGVLLLLAILGELVEFGAGAAGAKHAGGSRRGAVLALLGAVIGSVAGAAVGLPLPVVGSVAGALFFACLGAAIGALAGEHWKGRDLEYGLRVGTAAFWSRLFGTVGKMTIGLAMVAVGTVWGFVWAVMN